ncbi:MAG: protein kinase [Gemmataceae bacterium]|nr:protein kinase [Gemmataceae bacterium]
MGRPDEIRCRGRRYPVTDEIRVGGRAYFVVEDLGRGTARKVFDPRAGVGGDFRVLHSLPRSPATSQRLETLRRAVERNLNLAKIRETAFERDRISVLSDWVWGVPLDRYLADVRANKQPRPSSREIVRLLRGLCHGVCHFHHDAHSVHGDIKPANVVLEPRPTKFTLIDFGSAWPVERTARRQPGDGISAPYAAPEQLLEKAPADFRADYFSLGVLGYELLTLGIPFDGVGGRAGLPHLRDAFAGKYRPPSNLIPDRGRIPRAAVTSLDRFFARCLALDPNARFDNRTACLAAVDELAREYRPGFRLGSFGRVFLTLLDRVRGHRPPG